MRREDGTVKSPILKFLNDEQIEALKVKADAKPGDPTLYEKNIRVAGNITLEFAIRAYAYTATFDKNGGEGSMTAQTFTYEDKAQTLNANTFTKEGYSFMGWATTSGGNKVYNDGQGSPEGNADGLCRVLPEERCSAVLFVIAFKFEIFDW